MNRVATAVICVGIGLLVIAVSLAVIFSGAGGIVRAPSGGATPGRLEPTFGVRADTTKPPRIYSNDFDQQGADGWSNQSIGRAPKGQPFLGDFNNESVSLRVTDLPPHALLRVTFDLYIINTWDGSGRISAAGGLAGPDLFSVDVEGGPNLLRATFSNLPDTGNFAEDGKRQTYPAPIPSKPVMGGTASAGVHTLGYVFTYNPPGVSFPQDSSYTVTCTFPHASDVIQLHFTAQGLQSAGDESWGIAHVHIDALPADAMPVLDEAAMESAWTALVSPTDPAAARDAFWKLAAAGDATVRFLQSNAPGFGIDRAKVEQLVNEIEADAGAEAPLMALVDLGPAVEPVLREIAGGRANLREVIQRVLLEIEVTPLDSPTARQTAAASRLLSVINTADAQKLQSALAARPSPAAQPGTPEHAAAWRDRLNRVYRLEPSEDLRYVAPPFIPERATFLQNRADKTAAARPQNPGNPPAQPANETPFVAWTAMHLPEQGGLSHSVRLGSGATSSSNLAGTFERLGIQPHFSSDRYRRIEVPEALATLDLPGDWLIRPRVPQKKMLDALERILERQLGRRVAFEGKRVDTDVIFVRGTPVVSEADGQPRRILITANDLSTAQRPAPGGMRESTMRGFLQSLSANLGVRFIDETKSADATVMYSMLLSGQSRDATGRLSPEALTKVLANLSQQTSLTFVPGRRAEDRYVAVDLGPVDYGK